MGAFPAGALEEIIGRDDILPAGFVGTSSGAISAYAFYKGWIRGLENGGIDNARAQSIASGRKCWDDLARFQEAQMLLQVCQQPFQDFHKAAMEFAGVLLPHLPKPRTESPVRAFYRMTEGENRIALPPRNAAHPFCAVSATLVTPSSDVWASPPKSARVFRLDGLSPTDAHVRIAASGCLVDFSDAVLIDGKYYRDGAYSSALPYPQVLARYCVRNDVTMIILRTSQKDAHASGQMAFFNGKMDQTIKTLQRIPDLDCHVIQPDSPEPRKIAFISPELCFDRGSTARRHAAGKRVACRLLEKEFSAPAFTPCASQEPAEADQNSAQAREPSSNWAIAALETWTRAFSLPAPALQSKLHGNVTAPASAPL